MILLKRKRNPPKTVYVNIILIKFRLYYMMHFVEKIKTISWIVRITINPQIYK